MAARIRLLPNTIDDKRMHQLLRAADLVLDSFPIGSALHANALALSVGTPVVTFGNGIKLSSSKSDLSEIRMQLHQTGRKFEGTWLYQTMMRSNHSNVGNIPWSPTLSPLAGFYSRIGISGDLVANSTNEYFRIASRLANDREHAYHIRVKLLEAMDKRVASDIQDTMTHQHSNGGGTENKILGVDGNIEENVYEREESDISKFLLAVGRYWADTRA